MDGRFDKAVRDMLSLEDEAVLLTSAANLVLQEYVLSAPTMSAKHFGLFCRTFARLAPPLPRYNLSGGGSGAGAAGTVG